MDVLGRSRGGDAHGDAARENLHEASRGVDEHGRDGVRRVPLAGGFRGVVERAVERVVFEREGRAEERGEEAAVGLGHALAPRARRSVGPRERAPRVRADVRAVAAGRGDDLEVRGAARAGGGVSAKRGGDERRDVLVLGEAAAGLGGEGDAVRGARGGRARRGDADADARERVVGGLVVAVSGARRGRRRVGGERPRRPRARPLVGGSGEEGEAGRQARDERVERLRGGVRAARRGSDGHRRVRGGARRGERRTPWFKRHRLKHSLPTQSTVDDASSGRR